MCTMSSYTRHFSSYVGRISPAYNTRDGLCLRDTPGQRRERKVWGEGRTHPAILKGLFGQLETRHRVADVADKSPTGLVAEREERRARAAMRRREEVVQRRREQLPSVKRFPGPPPSPYFSSKPLSRGGTPPFPNQNDMLLLLGLSPSVDNFEGI